ncbi:MAG TPA: PspC domain-containing protein [Gaiellaceae bacterium]|nr:PspC domain-containing protein [Gaiellaceae bacterium]
MSSITDTHEPTEQAAPRRLVRTRDERWLAGVSAGLGRYFDVNPLVYRIAFAALAFAGGTGLVLYLAAWLVIPREEEEDSIAAEALRTHRERPWLLLGVGLLGLASVLLLSEATFRPGPGNVWLAAVLAGAALVWWHVGGRESAQRTPSTADVARPEARPYRPSLLGPILGVLLAGSGFLGLLDVLDVVNVDAAVALAAGTALAGAAVVGSAFTGRRVGGLVLLGVALFAAFGVATASPVPFTAGVGERLERPRTAAELQPTYELGIGELIVDLGNVALPPGRTSVDVELGIGDLRVFVPAGVGLEIDAHAGAGDVNVLGRRDEGASADQEVVVPGPSPESPVLVLDASVGLGELTVRTG